jgi:hypothetical protein
VTSQLSALKIYSPVLPQGNDMPKKKATPVTDPENEPAVTNQPEEKPKVMPEPESSAEPVVEAVSLEEKPEIAGVEQLPELSGGRKPFRKSWIWIPVSIITGLLAGFLLCYTLFVAPLMNQLSTAVQLQDSGATSSNQIKSDFSNMQLRQQEMEIRYRKSAAQLENANLYIFLLQMKEKTALARLYVEQKKGLEARETLAEIKTLYNHINPFIVKKDKAAAEDLDALISTAVQDLTADPDTAAADLDSISSHLDIVEAALFKLE